ncbi:MAG: class I SAM-dependent methyltransferase [Bacteroidota bacterium]|nr:class I SAM-dependent methyltransferase [Bacteroidota bacterium]
MGILQTAERSTQLDPSENVIFQRHLIAYKEAAKIITKGTILEIGSGEGYAIQELLKNADRYIAIDKYDTQIPDSIRDRNKIEFKKYEVPPIKDIEDNSVDFVVTFQVIEHIKNDVLFLAEIYRVLRPGGKLILTTPNSKMSLSRNPWHIREYTVSQMEEILGTSFSDYTVHGVYGNEQIMRYYMKNKESVRQIMKWDIFNLQYLLPRILLQIPYDILNRFNRKNLRNKNKGIVKKINFTDYSIQEASESSFDHFCVATK